MKGAQREAQAPLATVSYANSPLMTLAHWSKGAEWEEGPWVHSGLLGSILE